MPITERVTPTLFTKLEDGRWKLTRTWERYCYGMVNSDPLQSATVLGLERVIIHAVTSSTFYRDATEEERYGRRDVVTVNLLNPEDFNVYPLWLVREQEQPLERELPEAA